MQTTATIYSLVGALNKIPVAVVGLAVFHEPTNPKNLASIIIGLLAGVLFVQAKQMKASGSK
jgi:GDP-mannose transporter